MNYLALDLGAGSGRAMIGKLVDGYISLDEIHRFNNRQVYLGDTLYWDFLALFAEIKYGITLAVQASYKPVSLAADTWGVDFGLLGDDGQLLSNPVCYRDSRTHGIFEEVFSLMSATDLYRCTGIQLMEINTAFQLVAMRKGNNSILPMVRRLLFMPDLINYFLTGTACNEYTIASTSQLLDITNKQWSSEVMRKLAIPAAWMQPIVLPGTIIGRLQTSVMRETGAGSLNVVAVGSHDTASAIAAIPAQGSNWAFLSSGTWSLMGIEIDEPIINDNTRQNNFTNEGGIGGKTLFMRNITGLWLLQSLMREWEQKEGIVSKYETLLSDASGAEAFRSIVNPDDSQFTNPSSMEEAIALYCKNSRQQIPQNKSEYVRCVLDSLAIKYYYVMKKLRELSGKHIEALYVVGGGSRNELLNQLTANSTGMKVVVGSVEATALGNVMQQAIAQSEIKDIAYGRKLIAGSFPIKEYHANDTEKWQNAAKSVQHLFAE